MLIKCQKCKEIFDSDDLKLDYTEGGYRGEPHWSCPYCGDDQCESIGQCCRCGKYFAWDEDQLFGTSGSEMCKDCIEDVADVRTVIEYGNVENRTQSEVTINGFFASIYSPEEINDVLMADFMKLPEWMQKEKTQAFVASDYNDFADWYDEGGNE